MGGIDLIPTPASFRFWAWIRLLPITLAPVFAWAGGSAQALTAEQARDLPVQELARQVLGDAGSLFVEVGRPDWRDGARWFANRKVEGQAPPLRWLVFYGRPRSVLSSGVGGLCAAEELRVNFSKEGAVASLFEGTIFGFAPPVTFGNAFPGLPYQKELEQRCGTVSARPFFHSKDSISLGGAVDAVNRVHEAMTHGGAPWLTLTCDPFAPSCDVAGYADWVAIKNIRGLGDCWPGAAGVDPRLSKDQCVRVDFGGAACMTQESLTIVLDGEKDPAAIRSAVFRDDRIVC